MHAIPEFNFSTCMHFTSLLCVQEGQHRFQTAGSGNVDTANDLTSLDRSMRHDSADQRCEPEHSMTLCIKFVSDRTVSNAAGILQSHLRSVPLR